MNSGTLHIIATPIGNLADWSYRAVSTIKDLDFLASEDTRRTRILLSHYGLNVKLVSLHEHNEEQKVDYILNELIAGKNIGLVSDAGTPLISDPGYVLVKKALEGNINVTPIPGACAAISAISVSGIATNRFCFEGFLSAKPGDRRSRLESLKNETRTMIFYESPSRIEKTLQDMLTIFGSDRVCCFIRELTKTFETIKYSSLDNLCEFVSSDKQQQRGEIVLVISGVKEQKISSELTPREINILEELVDRYSVKDAVDIFRKSIKVSKQDVYQLALSLKK